MTVDWVVVTLSLSSALAFSASTILKKASATDAPDISGSSSAGRAAVGRFIQATLSHPLWLAGLAADAVGLTLQVIALHLGALALVQPLLVSSLLFTLVLRHLRHRRVRGRELTWAAVLTGCLIAFLGLSGSVSNNHSQLVADRWPAAIAAIAGTLTAGMCVAIARRQVPPSTRAGLIGIAVGAVYAGTAALIKATTDVFTKHGLLATVLSWQLYVVLALGGAGLFLTQLAFQAGPLTASLPAISTIDPLFSVTIGIMVYDEHLRRGPLGGAVLLGLLLLLATAVIQIGRAEAAAEPDIPAETALI